MEVSNLFIGVFLIIVGVVVKHFKLYFLIAGYNTMSEADKEKVNIEKVATLLRNVMVFMGLALILLGLASSYNDKPEIADYLFFPIVIGSVIYLIVKSNSKAYKK
jgi:hypothetical protein